LKINKNNNRELERCSLTLQLPDGISNIIINFYTVGCPRRGKISAAKDVRMIYLEIMKNKDVHNLK